MSDPRETTVREKDGPAWLWQHDAEELRIYEGFTDTQKKLMEGFGFRPSEFKRQVELDRMEQRGS